MAASDAFVRRSAVLTVLLAVCLTVLQGCGNASADSGSRMGAAADSDSLNRRVAALRDIYPPAQMREFEQSNYIK